MPKEPSAASQLPIPAEMIERRIHLIRGQKVMLDTDLAELYQAPTFRLNEAVKRNLDRFPEDFMFQLTSDEAQTLISQIAMSKPTGRGGRRTLPYAFTEHGVAMLSSVLNSQRAVQMNILIIRAFVKLRELLATHKSLAEKLEVIERTQKQHSAVLVGLVQDVQRLKNPAITRAYPRSASASPPAACTHAPLLRVSPAACQLPRTVALATHYRGWCLQGHPSCTCPDNNPWR